MLTLTLLALPVDLPADAEVALTLWAHDLRSSSTREATFSETFTLPPSAHNTTVLEAAQVLDSDTDTPYRKLPAVLSVGGIPVLDGVAVLEQTSQDGYDVTLYAPTADLHALVGSRKLRELDLSAYDHVISYEAIEAAQAGTLGYAYPLADDGRLTNRSEGERVLYHELPAFVPYATILQALVAQCLPDYTLAGSLLGEDRFQRMGFPRARPWPALRQSVRDGLALAVKREDDFTASETSGNAGGEAFPVVPFPVIADQGDQAEYVQTQFFQVPAGLPCDVQATAQLLVSVTPGPTVTLASGPSQAVYVRLIADPNGTAGPVNTQVGTSNTLYQGYLLAGVTPNLPDHQYLTLEHTFTHLPPGSLVGVQFYLRRGMGIVVHAGSTVRFVVGERTYVGGPAQLEAGLPDISQADALQLIVSQFQAVLQADPVTRTIRADLFTDLDRNRARFVDWTAKLDRTLLPATSFRLDGYAQRNRYAYDETPDAYEPLLLSPDRLSGAGVLSVNDTTLQAEADAYVAPVFALQPHSALAGRVTLGWLPAVADAEKRAHPYDNAKQYQVSDEPVIYQGRYWRYVWFSGVGTPPVPGTVPNESTMVLGLPVWQEIKIESDVLTTTNDELASVALLTTTAPIMPDVLVQTDSPDPRGFTPTKGLTSEGLSWKADLLPTYYPTLAALLKSARILSLPFVLHPTDISELNHLIPVRLQVAFWPGVGRIDGLFYLNLIDQYLPGVPGPVRCELIRLGAPVPGIAPNALPLPVRPEGLLLLEDGTPILLETNDYTLQER